MAVTFYGDFIFSFDKQSIKIVECYCFPGIRFFDPSLEAIQNFITSVNEKVKELSEGLIENAIAENGLTLDLALVYDAVTLYTSALNAMGLDEGANVTCEQDETWNFGSTVINYIRKVSMKQIVP